MAIKMMMRLQFECPLTPQSAANPQLSACLPLSSPLSLARSWGLPAGPLSKTRPNWQQWRQAAAVISSGSGSSPPLPLLASPRPSPSPWWRAIKSTQDMAGQGAANAAQYIKLYVHLSGSPKTLPDPQNWNRNGNWIPVLVFWRRISIGILHLLGWYFVSLSLFIDLFFVRPPLLSLSSSLSSSLSFFFYHSRILFVCLFLIRFIYFYLCWARRFVSFPLRLPMKFNNST